MQVSNARSGSPCWLEIARGLGVHRSPPTQVDEHHWLHPAGSLQDQLYQLQDAEVDALVVDAVHFATRGEELAPKIAGSLVFRIGDVVFGVDLLKAAEDAGAVSHAMSQDNRYRTTSTIPGEPRVSRKGR